MDQLPNALPKFKRAVVTIQQESFDIYFRDVIECVRALYGNPKFAQYLVFTPERHYSDADHTVRLYHDMHTAKWWWATQKELEKEKPGATIIPIIISSDKTQLTIWGGKQAYPVYLTIGNLPKALRRKPSFGGQLLLAYLPTDKLEHITNESARKRMVLNVMHKCLKVILSPLEKAGKSGLPMASGDGLVRRGHPLLAAYVGDYLEHIAAVGCKMGECATCEVLPTQLGENSKYPLRDLETTLDALHQIDSDPSQFLKACRDARVKPIIHPFWENLPYCDIYLCIAPDILHQLLQGLIKHLTTWIKSAFNAHELDQRCSALPPNHHVHHFLKGITPLSKITGKEHHNIARILLGLVVDLPLPNGAPNDELLKATRAMLDFLYLAEYPVHSTDTLAELQDALDRFHDSKHVFVELGIRKDFNLPKLHFLSHYVEKIKWLGTADNFNTEYTERLHIDLAKNAFRATNRREELPQMTLWLERKEKVQQFHEYIQWRLRGSPEIMQDILDDYPTARIKMAKNPSCSVKFSVLEEEYGATHIQSALAYYIVKHNNPTYTHEEIEAAIDDIHFPFKTLDVYHQVKLWLGHSKLHPLSSNEYDVVHAKPTRKNRKQQILPSRFDTVLVNEGVSKTIGITGHRVAQLRAIFSIPQGKKFLKGLYDTNKPVPQYYVYLELFEPFDPEPLENHGFYYITRKPQPEAIVLPLSHLQRSLHLFPAFDTYETGEWKSNTVVEQCSGFYLNCFSDRHAYHYFR